MSTYVILHSFVLIFQRYGQDSDIALLKINVIAGLNLAKKDIFGLRYDMHHIGNFSNLFELGDFMKMVIIKEKITEFDPIWEEPYH